MFCEVNPIPAKAALMMMGLCSGEVRLPLTPPEEANANRIKAALCAHGLIEA